MTRKALIWVTAAALLATACGEGESVGPTSTDPTTETTMPLEPPDSSAPTSPETTMAEPPSSTTVPSDGNEVPQSLLEPVLEDAAARAGVDLASVEVVESEFRDWPDGALGCPAPGMMYTQVITPGYRIVVAAGDERYDYRMNRRGGFRLCESGGAIPDIRTPTTTIPGITSPDT